MTNTTRKRFWPLSLAATLAVIGVLAVAVALTALPGATFAQDPPAPPPLPGQTPTETPDPNAPPAPPPLPGQTPTATETPEPTAAPTPTPTTAPTPDPTTAPTPTATATPTPTATPDPNQPTVVQGADLTLELEADRETLSIDLSDYFAVEADDAVLTYTHESSDRDGNIATVSISGSTLTIRRARATDAAGTITIMVWAHNGELRSEPQTLTVTVQRPSADLVYDINATGQPADGVTHSGKNAAGVDIINVTTVAGAPPVERLHEFVVTARYRIPEDVTVTVFVKESNVLTGESRRGELYVGAVNLLSVTDDIEYQDGEYQKGSLTVKASDEREREFAIRSKCELVGDTVEVVIRDNALSIAGKAAIVCVPPETPEPPTTVTPAECYQVIAGEDAQHDDMVGDEWRDDVRDASTNLRTTSAGHNTVEVLEGKSSVQLTVTACEQGPVYIRFLDSDMKSSGVAKTGLDSGGRLNLNLGPIAMNADMALKYDHYDEVTVGDDTTLRGSAGSYYQGKFRLFYPCPTAGDHFYVEVYEKQGKALQTTETISCVPPSQVTPIEPTELALTVYSDRPGRARLSWVPVADADTHIVLVIDSATRRSVFTRTITDDARGVDVTGLENGKMYHFAVVAQRTVGGETTYAVNLITQTVTWSDAS